MNRWTGLVAKLAIAFVATGCSGGGNPATPTTNQEPIQELSVESNYAGQTQTHLWGYYDVYFNVEIQKIEAVLNRDIMFAANVVQFLNDNPAGLQFDIIDTPIGPDYIDVDIDVSITHPLPGLPAYDGYDVRGVFIGDGSAAMAYNSDLDYAVDGVDQILANEDGYSRWYNPG